MRVPPRPRSEPLLSVSILLRIALAGGFSAVAALVIMKTHSADFEHARWLAYTALVAGQAVRANANRSLRFPVLRRRPNPLLLAGAAITLAVQLAIPYIPAIGGPFHATVLDLTDWALVAVVALLPAAVAEVLRATGRFSWVA